MTDLPLASNDFESDADDELVFEAAPAPRKSRRAPAKGRDAAAGAETPAAELPPSAAPETAAAEEPADPPAPVPQPGDASAGSASPQPAPRDRRQLLLLAIVGLALFTSLMSLGGMIAVSRTLAAAQAQRAEAADERDALLKLPATIAALDAASARLAAAAAAHPVAAPAALPGQTGAALTSDDFHRGLDALRLALDNRQPAGINAVGGALHSGFAEIGARLDRIDAQLARPAAGRTPPQR